MSEKISLDSSEKYFLNSRYFLYLQTINNPKFTIMEKLVEQIKAQYALFAENAEAQVSKNNKAAGTRARKAALEIMKLMKEFRKASVEAAK